MVDNEFDVAAQTAEQEFLAYVCGEAGRPGAGAGAGDGIEWICKWWARWYTKAGHKRLGRILVRFSKEVGDVTK